MYINYNYQRFLLVVLKSMKIGVDINIIQQNICMYKYICSSYCGGSSLVSNVTLTGCK